MSHTGTPYYRRPTDGICAIDGCSAPLDIFGGRCRHHRVNGPLTPWVAPQPRGPRPAGHGDYLRYSRDRCRCEPCRASNRARVAATKRRVAS